MPEARAPQRIAMQLHADSRAPSLFTMFAGDWRSIYLHSSQPSVAGLRACLTWPIETCLENTMEHTIANDPAEKDRYRRAKRRVGAMRGFYIHLMVYVLVNTGLIVLNMLLPHGGWWWQWTAFGWGIGLVAHATSVFVGPGLLGRDWEERKIRELMSRDHGG
jgi:hypothetical protein